MPTSFYDVVVLGTHLEPLLCAALLAGRGLRVLALGQGVLSPSYEVGDVEVERDGLIILGNQSPAVQSVLDELAIKQDIRQRVPSEGSPFQLLLSDHRIDVRNDDHWTDEIAREVPEVQRQAMDITRTLGEIHDELDEVVGRGLAWPPETFVERQQFSLAATAQRFDRQGNGWTSWSQLPTQHPLRTAFEECLPHFSGLLPRQHSDMSRARLHGHLLGDITPLPGGWAWFQQALLSRIRSWGSDVRPGERADQIGRAGRRGHIIRLARSGEEVGCDNLIHGTPIGELSHLIASRSSLASLFERVGEPRARTYHCSVHFLVERSGVPDALGSLALICSTSGNDKPSFLLRSHTVDEGRVLFTLGRLVEDHLIDASSSPLRFVREDALDALRSVIPFLDEHLLWIDSPHDGLPPTSWTGDTELACSDPWFRGPHTMRAVYEYPTRRGFGVCALPTRTPLRGVFLCSDQVVPGLGFEGAFLAAASAARIVGSLYRRQDWLRRGPLARRTV